MTTLYWVLEYSKVFLAYMFIMFVWPSVVFRDYLRGRSKTFWFGFCVTVQPVLVNTVVLSLGLIHLLYPFMVRFLFYGTFLFFGMKRIRISKKQIKKIRYLANGTYGMRTFLADIGVLVKRVIGKCFRGFLHIMKGHWWEYGLLAVIVVYGMIYFTYGAFQDYSYGFGDMYPHNAWIYGLTNGQIFSAGVYPEGMHCFLYGLHILFGIRIYSCLLFTAGIHIAVFLLSAYILLREVFRWRYTPMLALTMFLTVDVVCINEIYSMSRLQWTLPQEFALYTQFLCAAFLIKYLRSAGRVPKLKLHIKERIRGIFHGWKHRKESAAAHVKEPVAVDAEDKKELTKDYWDGNLLVFMLALAASLAIHFYATIMAFFLCVAFVPVALHKIFNRRRFVPLVAVVCGGFFIAVLPMAGALASGIPFQGSIGWAVNVINGTDGEDGGNIVLDEETGEEITGDLSGLFQGTKNEEEPSVEEGAAAGEGISLGEGMSVEKAPAEADIPFGEKLKKLATGLTHKIAEMAKIIYNEAYVTLYRQERANVILGFTALAVALWLIYRVPATLLKLLLRKRKKIAADYFDQYFSITLASIVFMTMYCSSSLGLPALIAGSRLCSVAQLFIVSMMMVPFDMLFTAVGFLVCEGLMKAAAALCVAGIYAGTILTGSFHGYLYYELTRYNAAVITTYSITKALPQNSYTIVSTVDELYQLIQYGFHEEVIDFVNKSREEDYTLPTEYVFLYVEKKPLEYAQSHFFTGPKWLAWEKYPAYYNSYVSQCPDITVSAISKEKADSFHGKYVNSSKAYSNLETRTVLESKMYEWCREFERLYPGELNVYYEDDDFVCYYFKQNVLRLYQLGIQ